jgi:hypothetical protein
LFRLLVKAGWRAYIAPHAPCASHIRISRAGSIGEASYSLTGFRLVATHPASQRPGSANWPCVAQLEGALFFLLAGMNETKDMKLKSKMAPTQKWIFKSHWHSSFTKRNVVPWFPGSSIR